MNRYIPVIGLEIHVELKTKSKMFCGCPADWFGKSPNTLTCPVCLGMPGALPVPNKKAIQWSILIAKALHCTINKISKFDRKHYFYPDLPKGYQISQYDEPLAERGKYEIRNTKFEIEKRIKIRRVHLEEDTGKLIHRDHQTLVDFNRSGVPLVEIVTEPDFNDSDDVKRFLEELQIIIRYLEVSDCEMEKGSMRLEPNISVKITNDELPNYKVEVKNINSFRFVKQAIDYEVKRQINILEKGETPSQETRGFNEVKQETFSQRAKGEAHDYRYFPEPDIPPLILDDEFLSKIVFPELPSQKVSRYIKEYKLKYPEAFILTRDRHLADYFEAINKKINNKNWTEKIANLIINKKISSDLSVDEFVQKALEKLNPKEFDNETLEKVIAGVIAHNPKPVEDYRKGKTKVIMFLVGAVMREMKGEVEATIVKEKIEEKLKV